MTINKQSSDFSTSTLPPGDMGLPLIGQTLSLVSNPQEFSKNRHDKYGSIFKTRIFGQSFVMLA